MTEPCPLSQWKERYPGQWLALRVTGSSGRGDPLAELVASAPSEEALLHALYERGVEQALVVLADPAHSREYILILNDLVWKAR
jgi:hypothetical protein